MMKKNNIKKYGLSLGTLFKESIDKVENVRDENLQILNLGMGGSIIHTDGEYYDLYDGAGRLMYCDGETVLLIATENYTGRKAYVVTGYDGESTNTYKFTKAEFDVVAVLIDDIEQL